MLDTPSFAIDRPEIQMITLPAISPLDERNAISWLPLSRQCRHAAACSDVQPQPRPSLRLSLERCRSAITALSCCCLCGEREMSVMAQLLHHRRIVDWSQARLIASMLRAGVHPRQPTRSCAVAPTAVMPTALISRLKYASLC